MTVQCTDLDLRPDLLPQVLELFVASSPGHDHAVCGEPSRMGGTPRDSDLMDSLGVLVAIENERVAGALAICPYSREQVTLWGPVLSGQHGELVASVLIREARAALRDGDFESIRVLVDTRNRSARTLLLRLGLTAWKDNHVYERSLLHDLPPNPGGVSLARHSDHDEICSLFTRAFPDSEHCVPGLSQREREGYRYYILQESGRIVAAAAIKGGGPRSWLSMITVGSDYRGRGRGKRLLEGLMDLEAAASAHAVALEVLADNLAAVALYESVGFQRKWTATILTGPV